MRCQDPDPQASCGPWMLQSLASDSVQSENAPKTQSGSLSLGSSYDSITPCSRSLWRPSEGPVQLLFPELERDIFVFPRKPFP